MDAKMNSAETLDLQANNSIAFDENGNNIKYVTRRDGSKVPFDEGYIRSYLQKHIDALNNELIDINIIVQKVTLGTYNGKYNPITLRVTSSP